GNVQHCTIVNCNLGLGVKDLGMLDADHLTFYSNAYGIACYEKNPGLGGGFVTIANSIISNSSAFAADHDDLSWIAASDCFFDTDTLEGINCNWMNPEFVNPGNYDFHLLEGSPAIGAANDFLDLGTLDHSFTGTPEVMLTELQYWHPDSVDMEYVKLANTGVDPVDLSGYAFSDAFSFTFPTGSIIAPGEEVMVAKDITLMPEWGGQIFQWASGQLNNSGDHIVLAEAHGIVIDHVQYLDDQAWPTPLWSDPKLSLISSALDNHFATSWDAVDSTIIDITVITPIVHMYPNPAHEFVIIQSDEEISEVEVFDSAGRWVLSEKGAGLRKSIQTGSLDPGLYMIRVNRKYACSIVIE
ncbi:MAG: lamin tail domain-containing protein, partial [Flavobacteriales bacterium]|nr:lamin tail domain-containing protein [Flavobacteriales bacterium]